MSLIDDLQNPDDMVRLRAVERAGRHGGPELVDTLLDLALNDPTEVHRNIGDAAAQAGTAAALESAKGLLRSTVGKALGLRHSPSLAFVLDDVQDHAKQIDELLAAARTADAEVQRLAAGAQYAGDPQPYKVDEDADDVAAR